MLYVPSSRLGFIHIPKTGGSTVTRVLAEMGMVLPASSSATLQEIPGWQDAWHVDGFQHSTLRQARNVTPWVFDGGVNVIMSVFRNPYSWYLSVFRNFYCRDQLEFHENAETVAVPNEFDQWLQWLSDARGRGVRDLPGTRLQSEFLQGAGDLRLLLVSFERLELFLRGWLFGFVSTRKEPPHLLRRAHLRQAVLSARARLLINDLAGRDFDFGRYRTQSGLGGIDLMECDASVPQPWERLSSC